jgi:hypothetical protein
MRGVKGRGRKTDPMNGSELSPAVPPQSDREEDSSEHGRVQTSFWSRDTSVVLGSLGMTIPTISILSVLFGRGGAGRPKRTLL